MTQSLDDTAVSCVFSQRMVGSQVCRQHRDSGDRRTGADRNGKCRGGATEETKRRSGPICNWQDAMAGILSHLGSQTMV